jgi:hypothetical protein
MPTQNSNGWSRCFCGEPIPIAYEVHIYTVHRGSRMNKHVEKRPFAEPEAAARKLSSVSSSRASPSLRENSAVGLERSRQIDQRHFQASGKTRNPARQCKLVRHAKVLLRLPQSGRRY